jgi:hypothetical protein
MSEISTSKKRLSKRPPSWKNILLGVFLGIIFTVAVGSFALFSFKPEVPAWKIFKSGQEVSVSFEYPSDWQVVQSVGANIPVLIPKEGRSIGITIYCYPKSSDKIIAWLASHEDLVSSKQISIDRYDARKIHSQGRGGGERLELLIKEVECSGKTQTLRLTMFSNKTIPLRYQKDFDHIVSSLKLAD